MGKPFSRIREVKPAVKEDDTEPAIIKQVRTEDNKEVNISHNMRKILGEKALSITAPKYTTIEHGNLQVSHAQIEDDYYYQIEFKKKPTVGERDVLASIMYACSTIVPNHIDVYISQPPRDIEWEVYTVIVKNSAKLLNAKKFLEGKLVTKFLELPLWSKSTFPKLVR